MSRRLMTACAVGALVVGAAACGASSGKPNGSSSTRRSSTTSTTTAPRPRPTVFAPLTGLPVRVAITRPALTVKVDNLRVAHPQFGVDRADVVYEEVVECGLTRLAAIFQSRLPDLVGPVRSVRKTDQAIVRPIQGIFAYSGGAPYAIASIQTAPVIRLDETHAGDAMYRDRSRQAPHNVIGRPAQLYARAPDAVGPPPPLFSYRSSKSPVPGVAASHAVVGFLAGMATTWDWDATQRRWQRSIFGAPDRAVDGTQLSAANVVIQFVSYTGGAGSCGSIGAQAGLSGGGAAWVLTGGHVVKGTWSRPDPAQPGQLLDAQGNVIRLARGNTWVELPAVGYSVTVN